MNIQIKRFDTTLPLPEYKTKGAAAFDLYARLTVTIEPHKVGYVPLNVAIQLPDSHWALLAARSSLHKRGLMPANGIGVGDYDFRGDNDEYVAAVYNFTNEPVTVDRGERIFQMIVLKRERIVFEENEKFDDPSRGGYGTTGRH